MRRRPFRLPHPENPGASGHRRRGDRRWRLALLAIAVPRRRVSHRELPIRPDRGDASDALRRGLAAALGARAHPGRAGGPHRRHRGAARAAEAREPGVARRHLPARDPARASRSSAVGDHRAPRPAPALAHPHLPDHSAAGMGGRRRGGTPGRHGPRIGPMERVQWRSGLSEGARRSSRSRRATFAGSAPRPRRSSRRGPRRTGWRPCRP